MKKKSNVKALKAIISCALFLSLMPVSVYGQVATECKGVVKYEWRKDNSISGKEEEKKQDTTQRSSTVVYKALRIKGDSEDKARAGLENLFNRIRKSAMDRCRVAHEDLSGCMRRGYTRLGEIYREVSFSARRELEKAIKEDCEQKTGRCIRVLLDDVKCKSIGTVARGSSGETEDSAEKSETKGTKKKK